jgi:hypothetical protein
VSEGNSKSGYDELGLPLWARVLLFALWPAIFILERLPATAFRPGESVIVASVGTCAIASIVGWVLYWRTRRHWLRGMAIGVGIIMVGLMGFTVFHWGPTR